MWGTEFGIGWIPFGGYCKIAGMIDESMDTEQMESEPQPWEYRSKPAWQRLFIITGGVLFNMILAFVVYSMLAWSNGDLDLPVKNMKYGMVYSEMYQEMGFQNGDKIISIDGVQPKYLEDLNTSILLNKPKQAVVDRNGEQFTIKFSETLMEDALKAGKDGLITWVIPSFVDSVFAESPANRAGLQKGDFIIAVGGEYSVNFAHLRKELAKNSGKETQITLVRNQDTIVKLVNVNEDGTIGFALTHYFNIFDFEKVEYTFLESIPAGINKAVDKLTGYVKQMKLIFTKEGAKQIGGFGSIAKLFPTSWDWTRFWEMTSFLSVMLAFMNILPIPALDGGYVLLLLYEMITRRKPSEKFLEKAITIGFFLLIGLLLYANLNDIYRLIFN
jgi:regulator of sigma E protease